MDRTSDTPPPFRPGPINRHPSSTTMPGDFGDVRISPDIRTPVYAALVDDWAAAGREPPLPDSSFPRCGTCRLRHPPAPDRIEPAEVPGPGRAPDDVPAPTARGRRPEIGPIAAAVGRPRPTWAP